MPYFECEQCGAMSDFPTFDRSQLRRDCPICEETTLWTAPFESEEGVSF